MRRSAVFAVLMVALLVIVPATGRAAARERYTDEFDFEDTIDCSQFNPEWTFNDDFHDFFEIRGQLWRDDNGEPLRALEHVHHVSNDVNSVTGLTLHEHNHFTRLLDFVNGTVTLNGAINIMERRGAGQVIHVTGHKILDLETGEPLVIRGPDVADDEAFCAAVAP
jgi:hypothetical protein